MRALALLPLLLVAAGCGGGPENKAAPVAETIAPGQWELTSEVTGFRQLDTGRPKINTPVGTRATSTVCVGPGDRLPTEFFSGTGYTCTYRDYYAHNGSVNLSLVCHRPDLQGDIGIQMSGTFQGDSVDLTHHLNTALSTDGDVDIQSHITGRRTGSCTPAPAPAAPAAAHH